MLFSRLGSSSHHHDAHHTGQDSDDGSGHGHGGCNSFGDGISHSSGAGAGLGAGACAEDFDGALGHGAGSSTLGGRTDAWSAAADLALRGDLRQLPPGLAHALQANPEARSVALDLAREQGLRTLLAVLCG